MKGRSYYAMLAVACFAMLAAFVLADSDGSDADSVESQAITLYTPDSESYSTMAYRGDALPDGLSPARYTKTAEGYWYNIDYGSSYSGTFLTYGELIPQMSVSEIRSDLEARFGTNYLVVQVSFKINEVCNVSYSIYKGGVPYVPTALSSSLTVNDFDCHSVRYVKQYLVGTDFVPGTNVGTYTLDVKCDGTSVGTNSVEYTGGSVYVTGYVRDLSGRGIADAVLYYTRTNGTTSNVVADSDGFYSITASLGEWIKVTSVSKSNFTFEFDPYNTGDLAGDVALPDIVSAERTVLVNLTDLSGTYPVSDANVMAEWYMENYDPVLSKYVLTKKTTDIVTSVSDSDGNATIICKDPSDSEADRAALFVYAQSSKYTFDLDGDLTTPSDDPFNFKPRSEAGTALLCYGDDFADLTDPSSVVSLRCQNSCIEVTVKGALDASSVGGAPIRDIALNAAWYYQVHRSTGYEYSTTPSSSFEILTAGTAFPVDSKTGEDGKAVIAYILPEWTRNDDSITDDDLKAYLYVYYSGTGGLYSFDVPTIAAGGTLPFPIVVDGGTVGSTVYVGHDGARALEKSAVADTEIVSSDVAYSVNGTITGTFPSEIVVSYSLYQNVESLYSGTATVDTSSTPATFRYTVKAGLFSKVSFATVSGYEFDPSSQTISTMTGNVDFIATCSEVVPTPYARTVPVLIETYAVNGLEIDDVIQVSVGIADTTVILQRTSTGASLEYPVYGRTGNRITSVDITGDSDLFIPEFTGNTVEVAKFVNVEIVTFADGTSTVPATTTVSPEATIRASYDGGYTAVRTSSSGTATITVPQGYVLEYKYVSNNELYSVEGAEVTSGPFAGRIAINLHGLVDVSTDVTINLTEQRVAYSSLNNQSPSEVTILSTETMARLVGKTFTFTAPEVSGFEFDGWYLGNTCISEEREMQMEILESHDGKTLSAVYGALPEEVPEEGIDGTTLMIGMVAIMIAVICFAYVLLQNRRY